MKTDDEKTLYAKFYADRYRQFTLNSLTTDLNLPAVSWIPHVAISSSEDSYYKKTHHFFNDHHDDHKLHAVFKNDNHHTILWETSAQKLKEATRWGIVKTQSITGQAISALGQYRVLSHERVYHGMTSGLQALKLALLDVYQDRFEALQDLESLVNKYADKDVFTTSFGDYISKLKEYKATIPAKFASLRLDLLGYSSLVQNITDDIDEDIKKAEAYLSDLTEDSSKLREANRARGKTSILEFVKQQMHTNLYALQGMNQDVAFSVGSLTRGEFNDCIEDARKVIDEHNPDLRNAVMPQHHGDYQSICNEDGRIVYDFSLDAISPDRERQALLAISFIEGCDRVDYTSNWNYPKIISKQVDAPDVEETLTKITAPKWSINRLEGAWDNLKYLGGYLWHLIEGIFVKTQPFEMNTWINPNFSLHAKTLRDNYSKPNYPSWMKALYVVKQVGLGVQDIFLGVYNAMKELTLQLPEDLLNDWDSSKALPIWNETTKKAIDEIEHINAKEKSIIQTFKDRNPQKTQSFNVLAQTDYSLTHGEENDILTAIVQGVNGLSSLFTHNLFAKDPVGSLLFTTAFAAGGASIFFPLTSKTLFGASYVNGFTTFSKLVGSTPLSQALCGSLLQAQAVHLPYNFVLEGRNSAAAHSALKLVEEPLTLTVGLGFSYGLGYLLANGFLGYKLPVISDLISHELGSSGMLNYPVIGLKLGVACVYVMVSDENAQYYTIQLRHDNKEFISCEALQQDTDLHRHFLEKKQQVEMVEWLSTYAPSLPKLTRETKLEMSRQINRVFSSNPDQALSLQKIIYPEKVNHSIAYQLFVIPLKYVPVIFRVMLSFVMSGIAWLKNHEHAEQPIARASKDLLRKVNKDIDRLITVASNLLYGTVNVLASPFKALAYVGIMFVGRISAFFDEAQTGALYKALGWIHIVYRNIGAMLFPERTMKSVVVTHPAHTVNEVIESYDKLVNALDVKNKEIDKNPLSKDISGGSRLFVAGVEPGDAEDKYTYEI